MKQLLWGSALAVLVAACGGGATPPPSEPQPKAKRACAVAADNLVRLMIANNIDVPAEKHPDVARVFVERCEADAWSDEAVACVANAQTSEPDLDGCEGLLTPEQNDALEAQFAREVEVDDPCGGGA